MTHATPPHTQIGAEVPGIDPHPPCAQVGAAKFHLDTHDTTTPESDRSYTTSLTGLTLYLHPAPYTFRHP
jgi:hypothetical protein